MTPEVRGHDRPRVCLRPGLRGHRRSPRHSDRNGPIPSLARAGQAPSILSAPFQRWRSVNGPMTGFEPPRCKIEDNGPFGRCLPRGCRRGSSGPGQREERASAIQWILRRERAWRDGGPADEHEQGGGHDDHPGPEQGRGLPHPPPPPLSEHHLDGPHLARSRQRRSAGRRRRTAWIHGTTPRSEHRDKAPKTA